MDHPGVSPVPRTGASEATERIQKKKGAPGWSIRGGKKHGISPRTGPSRGEPGTTDWSVRGNREKMTEHPTRRARERRGYRAGEVGDNGDRAQGSSVIPCAALCHKCLTHSQVSRRRCGQQWPACRRAQPRGPLRRRHRRRLRACRRPRLRRARRRSGRKGRGLQGDEGGKEPWWGRERGRFL